VNLDEIKRREHNCCTSCERQDLKKDINWLIARVEELEKLRALTRVIPYDMEGQGELREFDP